MPVSTVGNAAEGLLIAFVTIPARVVIALLTSAQPPESCVILKSVTGFLVVYVPVGKLFVTVKRHRSLALLNAYIVSVSSPATC